jgi:hypothetical protein
MNLRSVTNLELTLLKEEKGDKLADLYSTLNRRKKHYCQLLNILDVRQTEIHTVESSAFEVEIAIEKLKICMYITRY